MISALKINKWAGFTLAVIGFSAQAAPAPQHIDVKQYKKVEDVVVPLPNEVFAALNKLGPVNWKEFVRTEKGANFSERPRTALLLGNVIADGFIAVQPQDQKLSQLVSLGGWLRGTQILTAVVSNHFTQEGAELLHQPDLLRYFGDRLNSMPEYSVPVVESIKRALVEVRPLIDTGNKPISPAAVKKINEITTRLDGEIVTRQ